MASGVEDEGGWHSDDDLERQVTPLRSEPSTHSKPPIGRRQPGSATLELRPGAELQRYVILERLGRGGMGEVFLAYDPGLDRRLALKVLRHESSSPRHARLDRERLRREAQALAQLSHPNVVKIYDVGQWQDRTFIAMELVDGITLSRWLRKDERSLAEILPVYLGAGRGLAAAHAAGIVHRDFKPTNVMVGRDGRVCVLDFGLATEREREPPPEVSGIRAATSGTGATYPGGSGDVSEVLVEATRVQTPSTPDPEPNSLTHTGLTVGTPAYMAPEQHRGDPTDARTDQFSFCVSLFEAVARVRPFPGHDPSCLLAAKDEHHVVPVPESVQMPPWLRALIDRGLAADPADRFPSMDALLQALSRRSQPERRRQRWRWAGLAAAGLGAFGIAWALGRVPSPCELGHRQVVEQWNETHAQQVRRAFSETGLSYAETSFTRVVDQLDDYVEAWQASHRIACEAAKATEPGDAIRLDQRLQCLRRHLEQFEATVAVLREPSEDTVRRATRLVAALPVVDDCHVDRPLPAGPSPPPTPERAREVERLRGRLATATVLNEAGRYREGLRLSRTVLDDALDLGYAPLRIEAQLLVGRLLTASGQHAAAVEPLTEAALAAQALPYEQQAVPAMIDLVMLLGVEMARTEEASTWAAHARATLQRAPDRSQLDRLWARLWATEAALEMAQGHYEKSYTRAIQALKLRREVLGDEHPEIVGSHNNLANALWRLGKLEQAEHHYRRALEIAEQAHGKDHPLVATLLQNLGGLLGVQGKHQEARLALERGLEIRRRALGEQHPEVGNMLNNLGSVLWELGERETSLQMLQQALVIAEQALGSDDVKLVPLLHNLAELLAETDPSQARRHALRALDLIEQIRGPDHPRKIHTLTVLGQIALQQEEIAAARDWLGQAIALAEREDGEQTEADPHHVAGIYEALGHVEEAARAPGAAAEHFARALELRREVGHVEASLASLCFAVARTRAAANEPDERIQPLLLQAESTGTEQLREQITTWRAKTRRPRPPAPPATTAAAPVGSP